jgi:hypothetical protein
MVGVALCLGVAAEAAPAGTVGATGLGWIAGRWGGVQDGIRSEEHWTTADGGALIGMHKDVKDGRMTSFEFLRMVPDSTGRLCYVSSPNGAPPTPFCLKEQTDTRVVFENPEHDFPQRILYWREGRQLRARIEGTIGGKLESTEWTWRKLAD